MPFFATNGTKVYIGGVLPMKDDDFVAADFPSEWTEVKGVVSLGTVGDTAEGITTAHFGSNRSQTLKGTRNGGTAELQVDVDYTDPGQLALIAAEKTIHDYAFRVVFNDAPVGGTPSERMFVGKVMSSAEEIGEVNNVVRMNASVAINSNIVRVAPTTGG
ncbi:hypothetical protein GTW25_05875 [Aliihoeflea aestuarii]|jgi:hypothetical protein|uniref:hypothetical protein n=1 Tax=Aliihoeflea aestuarii TaxID=453840 RepID=UPI0020929D2C|nr:hypothetical protein [Aliihoeflea aestuarii]MCO6390554.1 hypothetical protein [Aliihoeflea aestuarii]